MARICYASGSLNTLDVAKLGHQQPLALQSQVAGLNWGNNRKQMNIVGFIVSTLLYPVLSGPVAAFVLVIVLRQAKRWALALFWLLVVALNVAGFFCLAVTLGDFFPGPGFFSCAITPILAVLTALVPRLLARRIHQLIGDDTRRKRWLAAGTLLIAALQVGTVFSLLLLAPWLCEIGVRDCSEFRSTDLR
jgi:hypothetical protein